MRWILVCAMASTLCCFGEQSREERVEELKKEILGLEHRAVSAGRDADRVLSRDFSSYRHYKAREAMALDRAKELKEELAELEGIPPHLRNS